MPSLALRQLLRGVLRHLLVAFNVGGGPPYRQPGCMGSGVVRPSSFPKRRVSEVGKFLGGPVWPVCVSNKGGMCGRGLAKLTRHENQLAVPTALFQQMAAEEAENIARRQAELLERLRFEQLRQERERTPEKPKEPEKPEEDDSEDV